MLLVFLYISSFRHSSSIVLIDAKFFLQALFLSPKNNLKGALAVLESVNCNIWVNAADEPLVPLVKDILEKRPMNLLQLPDLNELLSIGTVKPFPYTKTFEEAINEPFCYLHTSGSTGVPKPIPWSHGLIGTMDAVRLLPPVEGYEDLLPWTSDWKPGDTIYSSFPMSHVCYFSPSPHYLGKGEQNLLILVNTGSRHYHEYPDACPFRLALYLRTQGCSS